MPVFTAAVVLLLNIWGGKKHALTPDPMKEMIDVYRCMEMLKICEKRQVNPDNFLSIVLTFCDSFVFAGRLRYAFSSLKMTLNLY